MCHSVEPIVEYFGFCKRELPSIACLLEQERTFFSEAIKCPATVTCSARKHSDCQLLLVLKCNMSQEVTVQEIKLQGVPIQSVFSEKQQQFCGHSVSSVSRRHVHDRQCCP